MSRYTRTYTFLGTGTIWDTRRNKALCRFEKTGKFTTDDPDIVKELVKLGVPYEDSKTNVLARTEYAVEVLQERVKLLEKMNEEQLIEIEKLKVGQKADTSVPDREVLMTELDFLGAPYLLNATDLTLHYALKEYKTALREKARRTAEGSSGFTTD